MTLNLPNILTVLRLFAAPAVAVMFLYFDRPLADWFALTIFVLAALTDWIDGHLARSWKQETKFGAMLDPIADKAMVVIALLVLVGFSSQSTALILPATIILFREVFVSGLREFLGDTAGTLKVTSLAKWKTTVQMVAISVLFAQGLFENYLDLLILGIEQTLVDDAVQGSQKDAPGLTWRYNGMIWSGQIGFWLLWLAAGLTLVTGLDYFRKSIPFLQGKK